MTAVWRLREQEHEFKASLLGRHRETLRPKQRGRKRKQKGSGRMEGGERMKTKENRGDLNEKFPSMGLCV